MLSFNLDNALTKQLIKLKEQIDKNNELIKGTDPEVLAVIHRYARISMVGASTRIENAVLTDSEIDWMDSVVGEDGKSTAFEAQRKRIEKKLSKDKQRSIEEVAGCRTMLHLIYEQAQDLRPLSESAIRGLHAELLRHHEQPGVVPGQYKSTPNSVVEKNHKTGETKTIFETAPPGTATKIAMSNLVKWYNEALDHEPWTLPVACEFVYRFLAVHPFQDGNGRVGRGLLLLILLQSSDEPLSQTARYLAIDRHIERRKEEYYLVLNRCSSCFSSDPKKYNFPVFLKFMIKIMEGALADLSLYKQKHENYLRLSESALKILNCFKEHPELRLQPKEIIEETNLPRRTVSRLLGELVKKQFLQQYGQRAGVRYQLVF